MIPVHQVLPDVVAAVVRKASLTPEKVEFAWRMAVGSGVDNATKVSLQDGTLHVLAKETAWRGEIERSLGMIRTRLALVLGPDIVRRIKIAIP